MLIHREALELAKNAAKEVDGIPFSISCVNITPDGAVVVTDGLHWLRMKATADEPSLFDELAERDTVELAEDVLIPAEVALAFNAAMKKHKPKKGQQAPNVVVAQQDQRVTLRSSDGKTTRSFLMDAIHVERSFPDVDRTVLAHQPDRHIILSLDLLARLVRTLRACKAGSVTLGLPIDPTAPISLSCYTEAGPIDGAIMPMAK